MSDKHKTEIIAFCSGKGGTGKTLMCSCFGYALLRGGQRVLMIDGDPATDGLSLFLLGPKGRDQIPSFTEQNTFIGALERFQKMGSASFEPRAIHRRGEDHGVTYDAIISGKGLYGEGVLNLPAVPDLNQGVFRAGIRHLFDQLRESGQYDYVLVDTRGGFAFESTDLCALADSFIVITEADYTSFFQDRNLVSRVASAARDVESPSLLRAMIVNKAVDVFPQPGKPYLDTLEVLFRTQLEKEFPVRFKDTHPVPVSIEALMAYKGQMIPYRSAPSSMFCMATLAAFSDILEIVTSRWSVEQVDQWNVLVDTVAQAVKQKQEIEEAKEQEEAAHEKEFETMRAAAAENKARMAAAEREVAGRLETMQRHYEGQIGSLQRELDQRSLMYEREFTRSQALIETTSTFLTGSQAPYAAQSLPPKTAEYRVAELLSPPVPMAMAPAPAGGASDWVEKAPPARSGGKLLRVWLLLLLVALLVVVGYVAVRRTQKGVATVDQSTKLVTGSLGSSPNAVPMPAAANAPKSKAAASLNDRISFSDYAVLLTADGPDAASAAYDAQLATQAGYVPSVYRRSGRYSTAVLWDSQAQAEEAMKLIQAANNGRWASTSSVVKMSDWCPVKTALDPIVINNADVPVWSCLTVPSRSSPIKAAWDDGKVIRMIDCKCRNGQARMSCGGKRHINQFRAQ